MARFAVMLFVVLGAVAHAKPQEPIITKIAELLKHSTDKAEMTALIDSLAEKGAESVDQVRNYLADKVRKTHLTVKMNHADGKASYLAEKQDPAAMETLSSGEADNAATMASTAADSKGTAAENLIKASVASAARVLHLTAATDHNDAKASADDSTEQTEAAAAAKTAYDEADAVLTTKTSDENTAHTDALTAKTEAATAKAAAEAAQNEFQRIKASRTAEDSKLKDLKEKLEIANSKMYQIAVKKTDIEGKHTVATTYVAQRVAELTAAKGESTTAKETVDTAAGEETALSDSLGTAKEATATAKAAADQATAVRQMLKKESDAKTIDCTAAEADAVAAEATSTAKAAALEAAAASAGS